MSAKAAVIYILCRDSSIAAIVADRVRPFIARENDAFPYIIVSRGTSQQNYCLTKATGLVYEEYSLELYAETVTAVESLREAVETCVNSYVAFGDYVGPDVDRVHLSTMQITNISEAYLQTEEGADEYLYNITVDITVWSRDA